VVYGPPGPIQANVYGSVPPLTVRSMVPLLSWKHNKSVPLIEEVSRVGSVNVIEHDVVHPFSSVIVTEYVPAANPVKSSVVYGPPGPVQANVYGITPPVTVRSIVPLLSWKHSRSVPVTEQLNTVGSVNVMEHVVIHPFASVTVTEYVPAATPLRSSVEYGPPGPVQANV